MQVLTLTSSKLNVKVGGSITKNASSTSSFLHLQLEGKG